MDNRTQIPSTPPSNHSCSGKKRYCHRLSQVSRKILKRAEDSNPGMFSASAPLKEQGGVRYGGTSDAKYQLATWDETHHRQRRQRWDCVRNKFLHYLFGPVDCCGSVAHISFFKCTVERGIFQQMVRMLKVSQRCTPVHPRSPQNHPDHLGPPQVTPNYPRAPQTTPFHHRQL